MAGPTSGRALAGHPEHSLGTEPDAMTDVLLYSALRDSVHAVQTGYAVVESMRRSGVETDIVSKGIEEMRRRFRRQGAKTFYIEAAVVLENMASNRLAKSLLSVLRNQSPMSSQVSQHFGT